jgi:hypothetical protein
MTRRAGGRFLLSTFLVTASCSGGGITKNLVPSSSTAPGTGSSVSLPAVGGGAKKAWTVFVYMAADNNLESASLLDFAEMQKGVNDNTNLVVLYDRAKKGSGEGGYSSEPTPGVGDFTGARLLHVTSTSVEDLGLRGDVTMTDPNVLAQVGTKVFSTYPADHTALIMWDHAAGWHGFASDDSGGGSMSPDQISTALGEITKGAGLDKLSIVGFDSCLMGQFEVASALAPHTDLMLGSEEVMPGHGYDYSVLGDATSGSPENFGSAFLGGYTRQARASGTDATITDSMFDLTKVGEMTDALGGLTAALRSDPAGAVEFLKSVDQSLAFGYVPQENLNFNFRDLGQITSRLAAGSSALAAPAAKVDKAVSDLVIQHVEGSGFAGARGLSVYAPLGIKEFDSRFVDLSTASAWSGVMNAAYGAGADAVSGQTSAFTDKPQASFADGQFTIAAQLDPAFAQNLTNITIFYGAFVPAQAGYPDLCLVLGRADGKLADAANGIVGGKVELLQLGITSNGSKPLLGVFAAVPNDAGQLVLAVPVVYIVPGGTADKGQSGYLLLALDQNLKIVQRSLLLVSDNGTMAQVDPDPKATLQTIVMQYGADGSQVPIPSETYTDPPSLPADLASFDFIAKPVAPGDGSVLSQNLAIGVQVTDAGGTTQFVFSQFVG